MNGSKIVDLSDRRVEQGVHGGRETPLVKVISQIDRFREEERCNLERARDHRLERELHNARIQECTDAEEVHELREGLYTAVWAVMVFFSGVIFGTWFN